jgi:phenylacetate-CoA ligase
MHATTLRSTLRDISWPALPDELAARTLALQFQYEQSERWPAEEIEAQQFRQIEQLAAFCDKSVPFWRDRLRKAGIRPGQKLNRQAWSRLPIVTRREVQAAGDKMRPGATPPAHGKWFHGTTSGSTGTPLSFNRTELSGFIFQSMNLRLALWHQFALRERTVMIKPLTARDVPSPDGETAPDWGPPFSAFQTGQAGWLDIRVPTGQQLDWLEKFRPAYITTFPSNAVMLARHARATGRTLPGLRGFNTYGEVMTDDARALCHEVFGTSVVDAYSCEEAGFMTMQCPHHQHHHVMSEACMLEVVDAKGKPCGPGEIGRIVVTPLHNFAMPLLRYEVGDYAEAGGPCACGRGLPVLNRILGRARDIVHMPDGQERLAFWGAQAVRQVQAIVQHQVAQVAPELMEFRLVSHRQLTPAEEEFLITGVHQNLGYPFKVRFVYMDDIPRAASGKYQDFVSLIGGAAL